MEQAPDLIGAAPPIRSPEFWDGLMNEYYHQFDPFQGKTYSEMSENDRTELLVIALHQIDRLQLVMRTLALELPSAPADSPKQRRRRSKDRIEA